jgi:U4/U6.U5 tri-snRNP-associated protein 1
MNLDETNRMRIQLGLAPLVDEEEAPAATANDDAMEVDTDSRPRSRFSAGDEEVDIESLSVEERILYLKQKRLEKAKQKKQKTLADDDEDDMAADPMAWIKRSKQLEEEKKKAVKKARELFGDDDEAEAAATSASADPTGLKVAHDMADFKEGETVILTLKDQQILDRGRLADADDELEATQFVDDEKARKFREAKQKRSRYANFDDETDPRNAGGVLSKYDEDGQKSGFVIGAPDANISKKPSADNEEDRVASIRRKLGSESASDVVPRGPNVKTPSLLDDFALPAPVGSDYYNVEEAAAAKADEEALEKKREKKEKRQKKRKLRSREAESDVFASLAPLGNEDADAELGSRADREARARQRNLDQMRDNAAKMRKFDQAVESANNAVDSSWFKGGAESSVGATVVRDEEETEELEYLRRLQRTRDAELERERAARVSSDQDIVNQVAESVKRRQASIDTADTIKLEDMDIDQDDDVVFTATDEFIRGIRNVPDVKEESDMEEEPPVIRPPPAKRIKKEGHAEPEDDDMELDDEFAGGASGVSDAADDDDGDDDDDDDDDDVGVEGIMGSARVDNKGIAGFLSKLRSEGAASLEDYTSSVAGRITDKRRGTNAIPEESALDDEDDPDIIKDPNYKFSFKLEYRDKQGRLQTKKEAWRELGQSFHNKKPGKKKLEQRLKREKEEIARKKKLTSDQALQSVQRLQKIQQKTQSAFVVVTSNTQKIMAMREGEKFKNIEIDEIPLKKPAAAGAQRKPGGAPNSSAAPAAGHPKARPKIEIQLPQKK